MPHPRHPHPTVVVCELSLALVGWPTQTQLGRPSTLECQVAISQTGHSLRTLPVFFPKSNPRKDDTANQLLVCLGILQRINKSLCFLERRKSSSPCSDHWKGLNSSIIFFSSLSFPYHVNPSSPIGSTLFLYPKTKLLSSFLPLAPNSNYPCLLLS